MKGKKNKNRQCCRFQLVDIETALPIYSAIVGEVKFYDKITKERNLELEPDTYMMSTESGQHEARLSPEEAAAASLAA